ncbi:hypothetical protein EDB85DRAFT_2293469 [Lactarius pseudohatsudake]|nr:hypothetical protein EDB85DRAFT_2293469 [Lactarius pseudohatsudake]
MSASCVHSLFTGLSVIQLVRLLDWMYKYTDILDEQVYHSGLSCPPLLQLEDFWNSTEAYLIHQNGAAPDLEPGSSVSASDSESVSPTSCASSSKASPTSSTSPSEVSPTSSTSPSEVSPTSSTSPSKASPTSSTSPSKASPTSSTSPSKASPTSSTSPSEVSPTSSTSPSEVNPTSSTSPSGVSPTSSTSSSGSPPSSPGSGSNTATITGGVVGGVMALAVIGTFLFYFLRKRQRSQVPSAAVDGGARPPMSQEHLPLSRDEMYVSMTPVPPMTFYDPNDPRTFPKYQSVPMSVQDVHVVSPNGNTLTKVQATFTPGYHGLPTV